MIYEKVLYFFRFIKMKSLNLIKSLYKLLIILFFLFFDDILLIFF